MRKNFTIGLIATLFVISTSVASALSIDLNIANIVVGPSPASAQLGDLVIDPSGDEATATLTAGNIVSLTIAVSNPEADLISGIFVSIVSSGAQVNLLGANPVAPSILADGGTFFAPLALNNVNSGALKGNSPSIGDPNAELWVQGLSYGSGLGSDGVGAGDGSVITLFYSISGASGGDEVRFDLALTAGDGIGGASSTTFNSAVINPVPEPGTALLMGLGLAGLAAAGRRQS